MIMKVATIKEQNKLNNLLAKACDAEDYDYKHIEDLLKRGANPMGIISWTGLDHDIYRSTVYTYALQSAFYHIWHGNPDNDDVYKLTELFIRYGMDITSPEEPYSYKEDCYDDPLLLLGRTINSSIYRALKLLLDKGITSHQLEAYLHELEEMLSNGDACILDSRGIWVLEDYTSKLLLIASYPQYAMSEKLQSMIWYHVNKTNPAIFRDWNNYETSVDTTFYDGGWASDRAIIIVKDKTTDTEVWRLGIGINPEEAGVIDSCSIDLNTKV